MIDKLFRWIHRRRHGHDPAWVVTGYDGMELHWGCQRCGAVSLDERRLLR